VRTISLRVRMDPAALDRPSTGFSFTAQATDRERLHTEHETRFLKPLQARQ